MRELSYRSVQEGQFRGLVVPISKTRKPVSHPEVPRMPKSISISYQFQLPAFSRTVL